MIRVTVFQDSDGVRQGFRISGHSDYSPDREDILCSAVSALAENCVNSVEAFTDDEPEHLAVNEDEGFLSFRLKTVSKESRLLLDSLVLGLEGIAESYDNYIQIEFEEV